MQPARHSTTLFAPSIIGPFILTLLSLLLFTSCALLDAATTAQVSNSQKVIQDPKTKIIYYLESDLRHIAALSPDGKLLWCCDVVPSTAKPHVQIVYFGLDAKDDSSLLVESNPIGIAFGAINKKTGAYTFLGSD